MSAKWARTLPRWPPHNIDGNIYDLSHLHPFHYPLLLPGRPGQPAREVEIRAAFSAHAFTTGCLISEGPDHHYSTGPRDLRKFCAIRYELSKIQSAYAGDSRKSPRGRKREKVGFRMLVSKALDGRRAKRPP
jgi:hypothetical protein